MTGLLDDQVTLREVLDNNSPFHQVEPQIARRDIHTRNNEKDTCVEGVHVHHLIQHALGQKRICKDPKRDACGETRMHGEGINQNLKMIIIIKQNLLSSLNLCMIELKASFSFSNPSSLSLRSCSMLLFMPKLPFRTPPTQLWTIVNALEHPSKSSSQLSLNNLVK